jgi:hypothetical protein
MADLQTKPSPCSKTPVLFDHVVKLKCRLR